MNHTEQSRCTQGCGSLSRPQRKLCGDCAAKGNRKTMLTYVERKEKGLCFRCGNASRKGMTYCFKCGLESRMTRIGIPEKEKVRVREAVKIFNKQCENPGCRTTNPGARKEWHIDHCHKTNTFRGFLCQHCNHLLGNARDNSQILAGAIEYLKRFQ